MHEAFWQDRWARSQIGFHQEKVNGYLRRHWSALGLPAQATVLVPLCGKSLDLAWLAEQGHAVIGVELAERAVLAQARRGGGVGVDDALQLLLAHQVQCGKSVVFADLPDRQRLIRRHGERGAPECDAHAAAAGSLNLRSCCRARASVGAQDGGGRGLREPETLPDLVLHPVD